MQLVVKNSSRRKALRCWG